MVNYVTTTVLIIIVLFDSFITPAPVTNKKSSDTDEEKNEIDSEPTRLEDYMEYHRYLKEVIEALESDPHFREKLQKVEAGDIQSGKIADELEFVNHKVRTRLDEIKRGELERLRYLAKKQYEIEHGMNASNEKFVADDNDDKEHLDHANPHTFEIEDLKKLIAKTTKDLNEADKKRQEEFKTYEMKKEFEKQQKLKSLDDVHRAEMEKQIEELEEKHKKHEPLHHPGSKKQLEEVWEKQDHMEQQEFNPRTFFMMHDLDGNDFWDEYEVKSLFLKELDKMYNEGAPEDDMRERIEEMERMREHVFKEVDKNKDGLISYKEFLDETKRQEFQEDKGWEPLDQQKVYTDEEYTQFEKQRLQEIERLIAQGMLPPQPGVPIYHDPRMQGNQQFPPQVPHPGQVQPGQYQPHPGQMQPGQYQPHPGQLPQHPAQYQQGQYHPGQIPQQVYPAQGMPVQQQQIHPGQGVLKQQQPIHPGQQQQHYQQLPNMQINSNNIPPVDGPLDQGQNGRNQLPALNTNEVYPNQIPVQQNQQQVNQKNVERKQTGQQVLEPQQQQQQQQQQPPPPPPQQQQQQQPPPPPPPQQQQFVSAQESPNAQQI